MVVQMQYYIEILSNIDKSCTYPFSNSFKKVTLMSSDEELADLFFALEYTMCVFSFAVSKLKKIDVTEFKKPIMLGKVRKYRPNKKAQHSADLTNEFYNSKSTKKFLTRRAFFIAPGLKKLFRILTQNSYFHMPTGGTPLLLQKTRILESTPLNNRVRYLFHRVHSINIREYGKLRLELSFRNPVLASSSKKGAYNRSMKQLAVNTGVYIKLPYDKSLTPHKQYHP